jgi:HD-GYP domain-containing protein (c-di-GMP phosphodiesterase class II)
VQREKFVDQLRGTSGRRLSVSLYVLSSVLATAILVLFAVILALHAYATTRAVISSSVDESIRHVSMSLKDKVRGILGPAENQLEMLSYHQILRANTLAERLLNVPMAAAVLDSNPLMDAWYVGYPNGEFILFRALPDAERRKAFHAPEQARLMLQSQSLDPRGEMLGEYYFFDVLNRLIHRERVSNYVFDPRSRVWFVRASAGHGTITTDPYLFFTHQQVGATLARKANKGDAVVGVDATLQDLSREIADLKITPGSLVAVIDREGRVVALEDARRIASPDKAGGVHLANLTEIGIPALERAAQMPGGGAQRGHVALGKLEWELISVPLTQQNTGSASLRVIMAVPDEELFGEARRLLHRQLMMTLLLILLSVPAGLWVTRRIAHPLRQLAEEALSATVFDFKPLRMGQSGIVEVDLLTHATAHMRSTIARFLDVSAALSSETRLERLLDVVLDDVAVASNARSGALYLCEPDGVNFKRCQMKLLDASTMQYPLMLNASVDTDHPVVQVGKQHRSVSGRVGTVQENLVAVALETVTKEFVGVLVLELEQAIDMSVGGKRDPLVSFIEALSSTAAVAIETRRMVDSQKALLEAMIQLLAGAIDAKSPYTGGHCQRVPVLTRMLADAAEAATEGPFAVFHLEDEEREAVHVGAWLHDCGKITTPEYVVDKATKLETIYNRIHEVRMRFEVLKRDAEISFWKSACAHAPSTEAERVLRQTWQALDEEFAFVAACNKGSEHLDEDKIERLKQIAQRPWLRTLDDCLGLSLEEERQRGEGARLGLPHTEHLLMDRAEHIVLRPRQELIGAENPWGFKLEVPEYKFNRGELYNLSVSRGTLTDEERYIINDHIVQTIVMLNRLPFPRHLRSVPEIAGGHHERVDGHGYPKGLTGSQMSIPARIMAIADVFEALTAADRPYKPSKTLSESLGIMARMVQRQHLDADLFDLFLSAGVYRDYAEKFLAYAQLDAVDIEALRLQAKV